MKCTAETNRQKFMLEKITHLQVISQQSTQNTIAKVSDPVESIILDSGLLIFGVVYLHAVDRQLQKVTFAHAF